MLELNVDMKNDVKIGIFFIDKRKIPQEQTYNEYWNIREKGEIIFELRPTPFNRVVILKVEDKYWYLSAAADKGGKPFEELFFYEREASDVDSDIKYLQDRFIVATPQEAI